MSQTSNMHLFFLFVSEVHAKVIIGFRIYLTQNNSDCPKIYELIKIPNSLWHVNWNHTITAFPSFHFLFFPFYNYSRFLHWKWIEFLAQNYWNLWFNIHSKDKLSASVFFSIYKNNSLTSILLFNFLGLICCHPRLFCFWT